MDILLQYGWPATVTRQAPNGRSRAPPSARDGAT